MTVTLNGPNGEVSSSEVRKVRAIYTTDAERAAMPGLPAGGTNIKVMGEAVHVPLGGDELLVVLLDDGRGAITAEGFNALIHLAESDGPPKGERAIRALMDQPFGVSATLPTRDWTTIVIVSNASTEEPVLTHVAPDDQTELRKRGYEISSVRIEKVAPTDPVIDLPGVMPCLATERSCFPLNRYLKSGDPLFSVSNSTFVRDDP